MGQDHKNCLTLYLRYFLNPKNPKTTTLKTATFARCTRRRYEQERYPRPVTQPTLSLLCICRVTSQRTTGCDEEQLCFSCWIHNFQYGRHANMLITYSYVVMYVPSYVV